MLYLTPLTKLKRVLELKTIAPTYLVRDEETHLYGVQTHRGNFKFAPKYKLDEEYDFSKKYALAELGKDGCIILVEA